MDNREDKEKFRELLNKEYNWPAKYLFKFIVKADTTDQVRDLFKSEVEVTEKPSSGGKYISYSIRCRMNSADEILEIYSKASSISGIISL